MLRLFEVVRTFYVMAEDESEAGDYDPRDPTACTNEACEATSVRSEWWDSIPFGEQKDDKTCGQIITELREKGGK